MVERSDRGTGSWLLASRPKTLPAAIVPVVIGTAMAFDAGGLHWPSAVACLVGALLIQIGTNFANDYSDFVKGTDTAERVGPTRAVQAGLIRPESMRRAMIVTFALVLIPGAYILYRGGWPYLIIGLTAIASGYLYTGGPLPLGYLGLGDLFVLIFFGPVAVGGTYYVQTFELPMEVVIAGLAPGLFSVAILTVNNLRDAETDRRTGKKTLAVRFGRSFARVEYIATLLIAAEGIPFYLFNAAPEHFWIMIAAAALLVAIPSMKAVLTTDEGPALNNALAGTGKSLGLFGVLFSIGWIL